ncbi:hypothetical protein ACA910_006019 [Epithemia clementina (nom. ined.)]
MSQQTASSSDIPSPHEVLASAEALSTPPRKTNSNYADDNGDRSDENMEVDISSPSSRDRIVDPDDPAGTWKLIKHHQIFLDPLEKSALESRQGCTRFVLMSDTHGTHREIRLPPGDVLIHAGDMTKMGEARTISDVNAYFKEARNSFQDVICIAGNHDITLHTNFYLHKWKYFPFRNKDEKPFDEKIVQASLTDCTYLKDSSCRTTKGDLEVYGSPWCPSFGLWAFGMNRGEPIRRIWNQIPSSTDVLITHGPPLGRGDLTFHSGRVGCYDLLRDVQDRIQPRLHVFGHIHEDTGCTYDGHTLFVNASSVDLRYQPTHFCTVVDLPHDLHQPARVVQPGCTLTPNHFLEWVQSHGYTKLAQHAKEANLALLPSGNDLFSEDANEKVCTVLNLYRDAGARREWRNAAMDLYCESFELNNKS